MRVYLVFWLSGLLAGVILVERWRRNGDLSGPMAPVVPGPLAGSPASTAPSTPAKKPNLVGLVVTGAKLDAERVRQRVSKDKGASAATTTAGTGPADLSGNGAATGPVNSGAQ